VIVKRIIFKPIIGWSLFVLFFLCIAVLSFKIPQTIYAFREDGFFLEEETYSPEGKTLVLNLKEVGLEDYDVASLKIIGHGDKDVKIVKRINTHLLMAAKSAGVQRYFYASSACVYNAEKQRDPNVTALKEDDAYPAMPEDGYGWEKLFSERMCRHFREDFGVETRVARFHNVYGPHGTYEGGREKAPAAISRKVIEAKLSGKYEIEIWGNGQQTRSFMYIDDCIHGTKTILVSDILEPINLGSSELVSINQLVDIVEEIAGIRLNRSYNLIAPKGVAGRNSDNALIRKYLGWEPDTRLRDGMEKTYRWIYDEITRKR
jgi:nucleoside-diphosphate-sugar epimerase